MIAFPSFPGSTLRTLTVLAALLTGLASMTIAPARAAGSAADADPATASAPISPALAATARTVAAQVCSSCHGGNGISVSPEFPILASQQRDYLAAQLRAFRARSRAEPDAHDYMWGMATMLDERLVEPLAAYYAGQPAAQGRPGDPALVARGDALFHNGLPERGVAACSGCHGADATGNTVFPRLAGQHAEYLTRQIVAIQGKLRDSPVMHGIVRELKPDEIQALTAWLASR